MSVHTGEDAWEQLVIDAMQELDWQYTPGAEVAPGSGERAATRRVTLSLVDDTPYFIAFSTTGCRQNANYVGSDAQPQAQTESIRARLDLSLSVSKDTRRASMSSGLSRSPVADMTSSGTRPGLPGPQCRLRRTCGLSREKAGISASKLSPATVAMV